MKTASLPDLALYTHNPSAPLIGHGEVEGQTLFRSETGVITYHHRDGRLDSWFPTKDPASPKGAARILVTPEVMKFAAMAKWVTGCTDDTIGALSQAIAEQGLDITRTQWDHLLKATEGGEDFLLTNTYASFAFARAGKMLNDEDSEYPKIVALCASRHARRGWYVDVYQLDRTLDWGVGPRLVLRNGPLVP